MSVKKYTPSNFLTYQLDFENEDIRTWQTPYSDI